MYKQDNGQYQLGNILHIRPTIAYAYEYFKNRSDLIIAEIGSQRGDNADRMFNVLHPMKMYLIDPWDLIDQGLYLNQKDNYEYVLSQFENNPQIEIRKVLSWDIFPEFPDDYFDLIYIDGDHDIEPCKKDILEAIRTTKIGGIVGGHDYLSDGFSGFKIHEGTEGQVAAAVHQIFNNKFINAEPGDWWVIITEDIKRIIHEL